MLQCNKALPDFHIPIDPGGTLTLCIPPPTPHPTPSDIADQCELPKDEAGIIWDSICFAFLLLQRRVFMSYYFLHVVADIRASQILASR